MPVDETNRVLAGDQLHAEADSGPDDFPPFIPFSMPYIGEEEIDAVVACLRSGWITTGPRVKKFEEEFAEYIGVKHAVALNSCTAALHLALEASFFSGIWC